MKWICKGAMAMTLVRQGRRESLTLSQTPHHVSCRSYRIFLLAYWVVIIVYWGFTLGSSIRRGSVHERTDLIDMWTMSKNISIILG